MGAQAAPYLPQSDSEVLERLPSRPGDRSMQEVRRLRAVVARDPRQVEAAVQLARRYFEQALSEGDPRYVGYAQAALGPWWTLAEPPVAVLVMRATLRQYRHDFAGALGDLQQAVSRDPADGRAWSLRAVIHLVQADYDASRHACAQLAPLVDELTASGCAAFIDGLTGRARQAHDALARALSRSPAVDPEQQMWVLVRLAEIAWRLNDPRLAEGHFRRALALGITDNFLSAAYADFLLDHGRAPEVVALLQQSTRADALLLRLALAEHATGGAGLQAHQAALADRYAASRLRGDTTHEQEESRFTLQILGRPEQALALAQRNWEVQREPRDARVVLEAALALQRPDAAVPVIKWMKASRIEDVYLQRLAAAIEALVPKAGK